MIFTRRRFFQALAASALAAGVPLPIGFPREAPDFEFKPGDQLTIHSAHGIYGSVFFYEDKFVILDGQPRKVTSFDPVSRVYTLA